MVPLFGGLAWRQAPAAYAVRHSSATPADLITLVHLSVSLAMNVLNSAGVIGIGSTPRSASRALSLGSASALLVAAFSVSTIPAGVFFGAPSAYQPSAS